MAFQGKANRFAIAALSVVRKVQASRAQAESGVIRRNQIRRGELRLRISRRDARVARALRRAGARNATKESWERTRRAPTGFPERRRIREGAGGECGPGRTAMRSREGQWPRPRSSRSANSRSASTITWIRCSKSTRGFHPSRRRALEASPCNRSTSAGRR